MKILLTGWVFLVALGAASAAGAPIAVRLIPVGRCRRCCWLT